MVVSAVHNIGALSAMPQCVRSRDLKGGTGQLDWTEVSDPRRENSMSGDKTTEGPTQGFAFNHVMLRVKDAEKSLAFYTGVLGMRLLERFMFEQGRFSLYYLGYQGYASGGDKRAGAQAIFERDAILELTHNWGTEQQAEEAVYHNGNTEPKGFGHLAITVPDVAAACAHFEANGVSFVKRPDAGSMKGLAFIEDPDGYWIEIMSPYRTAELLVELEKT